MKRRFKNSDLVRIVAPLKLLMGEKLPVKSSYQLSKIVEMFNRRLKVIDDTRSMLRDKYGINLIRNEDGTLVVDESSENYPEFEREIMELMDIEDDELTYQKIFLPSDMQLEASIVVPLMELQLIEEPC